MFVRAFLPVIFLTIFGVLRPALAQQDVAWVQLQAQPDLSAARAAAQRFSTDLPDIAGFSLGGGWYAIVMGPYTLADAQEVLRVYQAEGRIASDSYLQFTPRLGAQFWPQGADILGRGLVDPVTTVTPLVQANRGVENTTPPPQPAIADETPAQARRSEALLTSDERKALQTALRGGGYYSAAIDGAFGRGTRGSMSNWQSDRGYEATGVLTTAQRAALLAEYNAPLTSVGMAVVRNTDAGIEMPIPMGEVAFRKYEPPFAHFDSTGDLGIRAFLISQPGDQNTLFGLYDIMQTLDIVPLDGPRERNSDNFTLEGRDRSIVSYTEAALIEGEIKGFTLIWPTGDEDRRVRVLEEMKTRFQRIPGVLDPAAGDDSPQDIDLVSGLEIRMPRLSRSGFFIDNQGTVITTSEVVQNCTRITLEGDVAAQLMATDTALGVAVLRPATPVAPLSVARFRAANPRLQSDIAVAGYSFEGALGAPSLTFGKLSDNKGLSGETGLKRLALAPLPGDAGGPVLDSRGTVLGMLLPRATTGQQLPPDVSFAVNRQALNAVLEGAGLIAENSDDAQGTMTPTQLNRMASGMTVLVSCWD